MQNIAISVSDGSVAYGTLTAGASQDTVTLSQTQVVTNDGNVNEDFLIRGQNSTPNGWVLATSAGNEQYRHEFSTSPTFPGTPLTTLNQSLSAGVASAGTVDLDLKITTPTITAATAQQSVDVTVVATASP